MDEKAEPELKICNKKVSEKETEVYGGLYYGRKKDADQWTYAGKRMCG